MERAVFGASEFFSQKAFFTGFRGIEKVRLGHQKGNALKIVEVLFNPWKVSYDEIVELFFDLHNPISREGKQIKNQSFIFFSDINQLTVAKQKKNELQHLFNNEIITVITPLRDHLSLKEIKLIS